MVTYGGLRVPRTLEESCEPARTALLVYDVQAGIMRQIKHAPEVTARIVEVLAAARAAGVRVFFCRHLSLPKKLMGVTQLRMAMTWQRLDSAENVHPWFLRDSPAFQLIPEVAPQADEAIFDKITMSAFEGTPLNIALHDCGITTVVLVGAAMEVGIEPTVRHAHDLGYIPVVVRDACGAGHEAAAQRSLDSLAYAEDALLTDTQTLSAVFQRFAAAAAPAGTPS